MNFQDEMEELEDDIVSRARVLILNNITLDNFDELADQFFQLIDGDDMQIPTITAELFHKAVNPGFEPDPEGYADLYAKLLVFIIGKSSERASVLLRQEILEQCQMEFQMIGFVSDEDDIKIAEAKLKNSTQVGSKEELEEQLEEKKRGLRRRSLGVARFIGELYKRNQEILTPKIMMECVEMLLCMDEEKLEYLCKLLTTSGRKLDKQIRELKKKIKKKNKKENKKLKKKKDSGVVEFKPEPPWIDKIFAKMKLLGKNDELSIEIRSALEDLRKARAINWKEPKKQKNPHPPRIIEITSEKIELHKAEKAWKPIPGIGHDRDVNEEILPQIRGIFNKLTPDNFDKLVDKFIKLPLEGNDELISLAIQFVFDKALNETLFSTLYAKMVYKICNQSQESSKIFRKKILDQCQKEFQKSSSDEVEIKEAELEKSAEELKKEIFGFELEEKKYKMRMRSLGNVRFIGELYKLGMLTPKIMMECVGMLLCMDEEKLECLCKLLIIVGQKLEEQIRDLEAMIAQKKKRGGDVKFEPEARWFDKTFAKLKELSRTEALSLRIRFALEDVHELRLNNWKPRRDKNVPMTIDEVRRDKVGKRLISTLPLSNLPPQRRGDVKKSSDWNVVSSNKFLQIQQQQTPVKGRDQVKFGQASPVLGPPATQWGKFGPQPPFGKVSQPPSNPRYQPGRFGLLDNEEKRTPASTSSRMDIVKPLPIPYNQNTQLDTSNIPSLFEIKTTPLGQAKSQSPPTPLLNAPSSSNESSKPPSPDKPKMDPNEIVKNISKGFFYAKNIDETIDWIQERFPGDQIGIFVELFSRKIVENSRTDQQKLAGSLVKSLLTRGLVSKERVMDSLKEVISDLPDIEIDAPMAVSYLAVFLVEIFSEEQDILWLEDLGEPLEGEYEDLLAKLVNNVFEEKEGNEAP